MDKFDRIYQLDRLLAGRRTPVSVEDLMRALECSRSSVYRLIDLMRDRMYAPIEAQGGAFRYCLESGQTYHLPGLWFTARELIMDILRHGAEVDVVEPQALREQVREELSRAVARYAT